MVILIWIAINGVMLATRAFDPYPFILLNLVLSCLAAVQAPVIMMSQNRSEARDRLRAENDYKVNLKAELEIRHLHEKLDHLLRRQYNRLFEIQQIQIELLQESAVTNGSRFRFWERLHTPKMGYHVERSETSQFISGLGFVQI